VSFKYTTSRTRSDVPGRRKPEIARDMEQLVGEVQGKTVYADEERFYKAVLKTGKSLATYVQFDIGRKGMPGHRTLDQLTNTAFGWRAFEVDGVGFVHRGEQARAKDRLADIQRVEGLRYLGIDVREIEHVPDTKLQTQEDADRTARNLI
jgi:hypothetical protein